MTEHAHVDDEVIARTCPVCGSYGAGTTLGQPSALLAVCDVLMVHALEMIGKRIVRDGERSRFRELGTRPWYTAHTIWEAKESSINKVLENAWDVIPAMLDTHGCCGITSRQVTEMLDGYIRDLLITSKAHNIDDLRYRFEKWLGIPLPPMTPYELGRPRA